VKNKITTLIVTLLLFASIMSTLALTPAYALSHYQIGYSDGCADNVIPGPHTTEYERGYADGQAVCSHSSSLSHVPSPLPTQQDSHYQIGYNDGCDGRFVPGHHTIEYEKGYADGKTDCSQSPGSAPSQTNPPPQRPASPPPLPSTGNLFA
jgi:hypothetical protein